MLVARPMGMSIVDRAAAERIHFCTIIQSAKVLGGAIAAIYCLPQAVIVMVVFEAGGQVDLDRAQHTSARESL